MLDRRAWVIALLLNNAEGSGGRENGSITVTLAEEEARWLATAVAVLQRILRDLPDHLEYSRVGLSILRRVAEQLPSGYYWSEKSDQ